MEEYQSLQTHIAEIKRSSLFGFEENQKLVLPPKREGTFTTSSSTFTIYNDGIDVLHVTAITKQNGSSWFSFEPAPPYSIASGSQQVVTVEVDTTGLSPDTYSDRLLVYSNDSDENPYPNGVNINLTVTCDSPVITDHPDDRTVDEGQNATFTVTATGDTPLHYQWKKDGVNVGSDSPTLTLSNVQKSDDGSQITCTVSNTCGNIPCNPATLTVSPVGTITVNPEPDSLNAPWTLDGPDSYNLSGNGDQTINNLWSGNYTLTWGDVTDWTTPSPNPNSQSLPAGGSITFPGTYSTNPVQVTVNVLPSGKELKVEVDEIEYTESQVFTWEQGSPHTIAALSSQTGNDTFTYTWQSWSDGGAQSHTITPQSDETYTATYSVDGSSNDHLAGATIITTVPFSVNQSLVGATLETSELDGNCYGSDNSSVWFQYTPPANGILTVETCGSDFDTTLTVWTGIGHPLMQVTCNDDDDNGGEGMCSGTNDLQSSLSVPVTAGTTYSIRVAAWGTSSPANLDFDLDFVLPPPPNDDLTNATPVTSVPFSGNQSLVRATHETGEVDGSCYGDDNSSVWFQYTPPANGTLSLETCGSDFDTTLTVWTGIGHPLTQVGCNDDDDNGGEGMCSGTNDLQSSLSVAVMAGTTYSIRVAEYGSSAPTSMNLDFDSDFVPDPDPPYTSGHNPASDATDVSIDTNVVVHVQDDGSGVDQSTISMTVEGTIVVPSITGTPADYTLTYNPSTDFDYEQVVNVTVDASDLAGNTMPTDAYSFGTGQAQASNSFILWTK